LLLRLVCGGGGLAAGISRGTDDRERETRRMGGRLGRGLGRRMGREIEDAERDLLMFSDILPVVYEDTFQGIRNIEFNLWTIDEIALL
jgi:hypothetical protein